MFLNISKLQNFNLQHGVAIQTQVVDESKRNRFVDSTPKQIKQKVGLGPSSKEQNETKKKVVKEK